MQGKEDTIGPGKDDIIRSHCGPVTFHTTDIKTLERLLPGISFFP